MPVLRLLSSLGLAADPAAAAGRDGAEGAEGAEGPDAGRGTAAHIVVQAGTAWALPMAAVLEITDLPAGSCHAHDPKAPWVHSWCQRSLPLWDLRTLVGHGGTAASADAKLLVVQSDPVPCGLVVEALLHLLPARRLAAHRMRLPDRRQLPFVVERQGSTQRSFAVPGMQDWPGALAR